MLKRVDSASVKFLFQYIFPDFPARAMCVPYWRMQLGLACLLLLCFTPQSGSRPDPRQRDTLIKKESRREIGGGETLNKKEKLLDEKLYQMKWQEMESPDFPPAMHFFKAKALIDASPVFSFLQKMPKGTVMFIL